MGDMAIAVSALQASHTAYQRFTPIVRQDCVLMQLTHDQIEFGYLRSVESKTVAEILSMANIECEPMARKTDLVDIITRAHKSNEARAKIDINFYGPRQEASSVGAKLSAGKLWLQRPTEIRPGITYDNPHFLQIDIDESAAKPTMYLQQPRIKGASRATAREEQLRRMVEEVYKSVDNSRHLDMVEGGDRVTSKLLRYSSASYAIPSLTF